MRVHVRFFAALREAVGREDLDLDLPSGSTPEDVWTRLSSSHPELVAHRKNLAAAVNRRYSAFAAPLSEGDEIVFIPPVSGG
jgi:molybdopterin converting factor subunit 1